MPPRCGGEQENQPQTYYSKLISTMANYDAMTTSELEEKRDNLAERMMQSNDTAEIELLSQEIEGIEDILNERDPLAED